ncbi:hypothetical protein [Asticcacaulis sp. AND118]|uniref:hypothetical protein n=1 Tax=Asticcacaulis sp. AND118 TaxID=2840468 RepID=UPI001CFF627D|nr:hypothetical protein [Asticcacaulis sp. AND118]UDF04060.1 hypothetical protein LH365_03160 [Asticcacaulis sp. AND118]
MSKKDFIIGVFEDDFIRYLTEIKNDRSVPDDEVRYVHNYFIDRLTHSRDRPRIYANHESLSDRMVNISLTAAGSQNGGETKKTEARKNAIVTLLASGPGPFSLDDVMADLKDKRLVEEKQRNTIISALRRMRTEAKLIDSPTDGEYVLTAVGRALFEQLSSQSSGQ